MKRAENTTTDFVKLVISSQIKRNDSASNYRFLSHSQAGKEPHAGSSPRGDQGSRHKRNEMRRGNTWPLANRTQPTPVRCRLEQAGPRCASSALRRDSAPRPRRATGTPGSRCRQPGTETCPGRARGAGIPQDRPDPPRPSPSRLPTPSRGPQSPRAETRDGAGRTARASPPRHSQAPPPRRGAATTSPGGGAAGPGPPRGTASPSHWLSATRWAPCPPSCLSPRSALAARKRAPIPPSPRAEDGKPMAEAPMRRPPPGRGVCPCPCPCPCPLLSGAAGAAPGTSAARSPASAGACVPPGPPARTLAEENPNEVARRPKSAWQPAALRRAAASSQRREPAPARHPRSRPGP